MSFPFQSAGINYANPSVIGGSGSGVKIFPSLLNATLPATLQLLEQANGQIVTLNAAGELHVHGTSPTIAPTLYNGTSLTASSDGTALSLLTTAQLFSSTGASYPWALEVKIQGDKLSGVVQVVSATFACNGTASSTFTNTSLTGQTFLDNQPINLILGLNFGVGDAANAASMYQFELS